MNIQLELDAIEQLSEEYDKASKDPNTSVFELMDIKNRLDMVRLLIVEAIIEDLKKVG